MNAHAKILVVDDDAVIGKSFSRVLSERGYNVKSVLSGQEAMENIEESDYDAVFTDIKMPDMDGLEVTKRIKERCPWTPVVVITGYGSEENEAKASVLGADGFVRKPLTPEMIESITIKALERREEESAAEATSAYVDQDSGRKFTTIAKNIGLFLASPLIGLAYVIALPFVFFGMIAKLGYEAITK
jgi:DNA-binding NtrC family response regulator